MVALVQARPLDLNDMLPEAARTAIREVLKEDSKATRRVYAALARKVWSLLVERRFDAEVRDWHVLVNNVRSKIHDRDQPASERLIALADLLRESIGFAELSPAAAVANRPRARAILERLGEAQGFVKRRELMDELKLSSSNLSNVLTQLQAHDLVRRRRGKGKEAEFEITRLGRDFLKGPAPKAEVPMNLYEASLREILRQHGEPVFTAYVDHFNWIKLAHPRTPATCDPAPRYFGGHIEGLTAYSATPDRERLPMFDCGH